MSFSKYRRKILMVPQPVAGTYPTSPVYMNLEAHESSEITSENEWMQSKAIKPNGTMAKGRKTQIAGGINLDIDMKRDDHMDYILQMIMGSAWVEAGAAGKEGDTLKTGTNEYLAAFEMQEVDGSLIHYFWQQDCILNELNLQHSADSTEGLKASVKGSSIAAQVRSLTPKSGATAPATTGADFLPYGTDEITIAIAGQTIEFASFNITVGTPVSKEWKYNSASARGHSYGQQACNIELVAYRGATLALDTLADSDTPVALTVTLGGTVTRKYTLTVPAMQFTKRTTNVTQGDSRLISLVGQATFDPTAGSDISWLRS